MREKKHHPNDAEMASRALATMLGAVANLNDTMAQVSTGMKTMSGVRQMATNPRAFKMPYTQGGNPGLISSSPGVLYGINCADTGRGGALEVRVYDSLDASGALLWFGMADIGQTMDAWFPNGISFVNGIYVDAVRDEGTGLIEGVVYLNGGRLPNPHL